MTEKKNAARERGASEVDQLGGLITSGIIRHDPQFQGFCARLATHHAEIDAASPRSRARRMYPVVFKDARWDWALRREVWFVHIIFGRRKCDHFELGSFNAHPDADAPLRELSRVIFRRRRQ